MSGIWNWHSGLSMFLSVQKALLCHLQNWLTPCCYKGLPAKEKKEPLPWKFCQSAAWMSCCQGFLSHQLPIMGLTGEFFPVTEVKRVWKLWTLYTFSVPSECWFWVHCSGRQAVCVVLIWAEKGENHGENADRLLGVLVWEGGMQENTNSDLYFGGHTGGGNLEQRW